MSDIHSSRSRKRESRALIAEGTRAAEEGQDPASSAPKWRDAAIQIGEQIQRWRTWLWVRRSGWPKSIGRTGASVATGSGGRFGCSHIARRVLGSRRIRHSWKDSGRRGLVWSSANECRDEQTRHPAERLLSSNCRGRDETLGAGLAARPPPQTCSPSTRPNRIRFACRSVPCCGDLTLRPG